ncbi:RND efflux system, inner membrane transporter CmeB [hydrothermal vent metagenome]|uniref:RND efflux system, inner membrane transporter CmeB n=1 Tax=hydrothermal vent metagenome TaxID=652676 RepID=A0A3B1AQV1_9ZZZZ
MNNLKRLVFTLILALGTTGIVNANIVYTDTYDAGGIRMNGTLFGADDSVSWQFNILDAGYNPASQEITSATIGLNLRDDRGWFERFLIPEFANLSAGLNTYSWEVDTGTSSFSIDSLLTLSDTGLLDVTLVATFGDFYFDYATLTVDAVNGAVQIPEPTSLALMGLGLLGLAFVQRRKKSAHQKEINS